MIAGRFFKRKSNGIRTPGETRPDLPRDRGSRHAGCVPFAYPKARSASRLRTDCVPKGTQGTRVRSTRDLLNVLASVADRGAGFRSLRDAWGDTTTAHGRLMLTVLGGSPRPGRTLVTDGRKERKGRAPPCAPRLKTCHQAREFKRYEKCPFYRGLRLIAGRFFKRKSNGIQTRPISLARSAAIMPTADGAAYLLAQWEWQPSRLRVAFGDRGGPKSRLGEALLPALEHAFEKLALARPAASTAARA